MAYYPIHKIAYYPIIKIASTIMRNCHKLAFSMAQRQLLQPEGHTVEPLQDNRFKVCSPNFQFVIDRQPPAQQLIYQHQADTPAAVLKLPAIHILPPSLPALNKSEKMTAVTRQLQRQYENSFRNCRSGKEVFHMERKVKADMRKSLSFIGTLSGKHQHLLAFESLLDQQASSTQLEYEKRGVAVDALGDRVYPLGKVWMPSSQRYLTHFLKIIGSLPLKADNVLDLGCGSGILSFLFAKAHKRSRIIALDKHAQAVRTTSVNAARMKMHNIQAIQFDLLQQKQFQLKTIQAQLPPSFDCILLNPPWITAPKLPGQSILADAVYDGHLLMLENSLQLAKRLLSKEGRIVVIYSDLSKLIGLTSRGVEQLAEENGLRVVSREQLPLVEGLPKKSALQEFKSKASILTYVLQNK